MGSFTEEMTFMRLFFLFLCSVILLGCSSKNQNTGPLSKLDNFDVFLFLSPYEDFEKAQLYDAIVENFGKFGEVKFVEKFDKTDVSNKTPALLLSLGGFKESDAGSISLIEDVVARNGYQTACQVWKIDYKEENLPYPVATHQGIEFKRKEDVDQNKKRDLKFVAQKLITSFVDEFYHDNSSTTKLKFHLIKN